MVQAFRTIRPTFTEQQFELYQNSFWAVPTGWGDARSRFLLSRLWRAGGSPAISVLPVLGQFAHAPFREALHLSKEELARLSGIHPRSVGRAARILDAFNLASCKPVTHHGVYVTRWCLAEGLATRRIPSSQGLANDVDPKRSSHSKSLENGESAVRMDPKDYFYFAAQLIYGGNWSRLTATQRVLYLAVGIHTRKYDAPLERNPLVTRLHPNASLADLERCYESRPDGERWLRLASVSEEVLCQTSGLSRSGLQLALRGLKHPASWDTTNDPNLLRHSPLGVYPTLGGNLIYHLRDHVSHWPWDELNCDNDLSGDAAGSLSEEDFVRFFGR